MNRRSTTRRHIALACHLGVVEQGFLNGQGPDPLSDLLRADLDTPQVHLLLLGQAKSDKELLFPSAQVAFCGARPREVAL